MGRRLLCLALTEADFAQDGEVAQLSDDELASVAGGKVCFCAVGGGGEKGGKDTVCACVAYGVGEDNEGDQRCVCAIGGQGKSSN